ncbi:MAG: hypothetical protein M3Z46_06905, partial [Actinomycetota bacterium]|nr:hypothetical protein [Actinomycetota bacterium]
VAGCLLVHINQAFTEGPFTPTQSIGVFTAAVVGGLGSLPGAVIGALYLNGGTWFLSDKWQLLPSAVGVLFVLMLLPGGLGNLLYRGRDAALRRLARRRGIVVPSLSGDSQVPGSSDWPLSMSDAVATRDGGREAVASADGAVGAVPIARR